MLLLHQQERGLLHSNQAYSCSESLPIQTSCYHASPWAKRDPDHTPNLLVRPGDYVCMHESGVWLEL